MCAVLKEVLFGNFHQFLVHFRITYKFMITQEDRKSFYDKSPLTKVLISFHDENNILQK